MVRRERRDFTDAFKTQMVQLYLNSKSKQEIIKAYDLTPSSLGRRVKQHQNTGSFKEKDNRIAEENELLQLRRENRQLKIENDILKQATHKFTA